ncbi:MAG: cobyrinate a,c-diamide synthase [Cyanophyceae cyanobacterium]
MALIIAGERSGVGKTTVTLAILAYLAKQGRRVQSFKVGPDYIDPMFHTAITGRPCRNLDPVLTSSSYVKSCFARHCQSVELALVEGVMGLFDGVKTGQSLSSADLPNDYASTAHVARLLNLPVLLVVDTSRLSGSVAALVHGYCSLDPRITIAGIVLNRVGSDRHLQLLKDALEPLQLPVIGILRRHESLPSRHLGLVPTAELTQLEQRFDQLAQIGKVFNWNRLFPLLKLPAVRSSPSPLLACRSPEIRLAVARDRAFNFYYEDNFDLLRQGAELVFWSPLTESLPSEIHGLYLGGGFPEVFAQQLAQNRPALDTVRSAIQTGLPTYAECGGLMYLCEQLIDFTGQSWPMTGVLPTTTVMTNRLTLGYRRATTLANSLLLRSKERVWGHEFHRSQLTMASPRPLFETRSLSSFVGYDGWQLKHLHASYIHVHFGEYQRYLARFLQQCKAFRVNSKPD